MVINPFYMYSRDVFCCPVLFSLWRIRRSWHKNVVKKCSSIEVQQILLKRLGKIMDSIWSKVDYMDALEELFQDFVDQTTFMQYFKACWVPKIGKSLIISSLSILYMLISFYVRSFSDIFYIEMWLATIRSLPLASQESCGAIEGYHVKLKLKIYDDSHLGALQRVDWLVHKLTTELHSGYWLDLYADESGSFPVVKEEYISSTSWHRALQIPDDAVVFDDKEHLFAKVVSQKDSGHTCTVWNPGSEFALCDCSWSMQGNLCKHIIKVNMMCQHRKDYQPTLSYQSFEHVLLNLWRKPMDDSLSLDQSMAWARQAHDKIQRLVELTTSQDIAKVTKNLPLKWVCKKERTFVGRPADSTAVLSPTSKSDAQKSAARKKNRKRKRLSRIRGSS